MKNIPVMIIDHQEATRFGLSKWIEETQGLNMVASTGCLKEATSLLESVHLKPEVIVLAPTTCIRSEMNLSCLSPYLHPNTVTRLLCWHADQDSDLIPLMLQFGADGVLLKDEPLEVTAKAIQRIHQGDLRCYSKPVIEQYVIPSKNQGNGGLTQRERQLLHLLSEGLNNQQIAERLNLALSTVKNCISGIYKKIKARNRSEATAWAIRNIVLLK